MVRRWQGVKRTPHDVAQHDEGTENEEQKPAVTLNPQGLQNNHDR